MARLGRILGGRGDERKQLLVRIPAKDGKSYKA